MNRHVNECDLVWAVASLRLLSWSPNKVCPNSSLTQNISYPTCISLMTPIKQSEEVFPPQQSQHTGCSWCQSLIPTTAQLDYHYRNDIVWGALKKTSCFTSYTLTLFFWLLLWVHFDFIHFPKRILFTWQKWQCDHVEEQDSLVI